MQPWRDMGPRYMKVGDTYWRGDNTVKFYNKSGCAKVADYSENTGIKLEAVYPSLPIGSNTLNDVAKLTVYFDSNYTQPWEDYYYAKGVGLVKWQDRTSGAEFHFTGYGGSQPTRESICNP